MPSTMTLISSATVGAGGAASIDLTSIPQTYTDLCLKVSVRSNTSRASNGFLFDIRPNGSSANMTRRSLYAEGTGIGSGTGADGYNQLVNPSDYTASIFASTDIYILNYTSSNNKSMITDSVTENNATTNFVLLGYELWSNSSAISSITLTCLAGSFVQYSTATLYGIKNS